MNKYIAYWQDIINSFKRYTSLELVSVILCSMFWVWNLVFLYFVKATRFVVGYENTKYVCPVVFGLTFLALFKDVIKKIKITDWIFFISYYTILMIAIAQGRVFGYDQTYLQHILQAFMFYFLGLFICFDKTLTKIICIFSYTGLFFTIVLYSKFTHLSDNLGGSIDNLGRAYMLLPLVLVFTYHTIVNRSLISSLTLILSFMLLLGMGNRGCALIVLAYIAVTTLFVLFVQKDLSLPQKFIFVILFFALTVAVFAKTEGFIENHNLSLRVIDKTNEGTYFKDDARNSLETYAYEAIQKHIAGYGMFGDREVLGTYPHRIDLELMLQYGVVGGILILLWILYKYARAFSILCRDDKDLALAFLLILAPVSKLLMSGTYTREPFLFLSLGIATSIIRQHNKNRVFRVWLKQKERG